jgi:putative tricarboxylic transport membrane protein
MTPRARSVSLALAVCATSHAIGTESVSAQTRPVQSVEIIVPFAPGGAVDRIGRTLHGLFQDKRIGLNAVVVNKPGGAGSVAWAYLEKLERSAAHIAIVTPTIMTNHIMGRSRYSHSDFTPLAKFYSESVAITVAADSPIKDWRELMGRLSANPASVTFGSSNREGAAPLTFAMVMKEAGGDPRSMKLVVFNSASEALTAAMGGHVDVALSIADTVKSQLREQRVRVLAISATRRPAHEPFAAVPTLTEHGVNVSFRSWRGMLGPRGLSAAQVAAWDEVFGKTVATDEWAREVAAYDALNEYLDSAQTRTFFQQQYDQLKSIMIATGLAKG